MHVVVFGGNGTVGRRIVLEAFVRGHRLRSVARRAAPPNLFPDAIKTVEADALNPVSVMSAVHNADAVVCAIGPAAGEAPASLVEATRGLITSMLTQGVTRLLIVGSAATISVRPGIDYANTLDLPEAWIPTIAAQRRVLALLKSGSFPALQWTYVSPPPIMKPGDRSGHYRLGPGTLDLLSLTPSAITTEDFAVAIVDELELASHIQRHVAVRH